MEACFKVNVRVLMVKLKENQFNKANLVTYVSTSECAEIEILKSFDTTENDKSQYLQQKRKY